MRFTIKREVFLKGLTIASDAIPSKSMAPVLLNFYLEMDEEKLTILSSDSIIAIKHLIYKKDGDKDIILDSIPGKCLVVGKFTIEIIRKLEGELVTLELIDNSLLRVSNEITEYQLRTSDGNEYPDISLTADDEHVTLDFKLFQKLVSSTSFAAASKSPRKILEGLNIKCNEHVLSFATTDSFRLARKIVTIEESHEFSYTVPVNVLTLISRLEGISKVEISFDQSHAIFTAENTLISTRLLIGDYPSIDRLIPTTFPYILNVDSQKFIAAMERISLVAIERENVVKFVAENNGVELSAKSNTLGSSKESLVPNSFSGDRLEISFNCVFLIEAIRALASPKVNISFAGEGRVFTITSEEEGVLQLITPVRTAY